MFGLLGDLVQIATAPVKVASSLARTVTKPLADTSKDIVETFRDVLGDDEKKRRTEQRAVRHLDEGCDL